MIIKNRNLTVEVDSLTVKSWKSCDIGAKILELRAKILEDSSKELQDLTLRKYIFINK